MKGYADTKKVAGVCGISERQVRRMCVNGEIPGAIKINGRWWIPETALARLAKANAPDNAAEPQELQHLPVKKREEAIRRLGIIRRFERFAAGASCTRTEALELFVAGNKPISRRTFERWVSRYQNQGLPGLVDGRGEHYNSEIINPEAFELFKSMYLKPQQLSLKTCWQNVCFVNHEQGHNWRIPPVAVMYRYVKRMIPLYVQVLHREGLAAYEAKCAPYVQADPDTIEPGQVWVGDHSQFNCWIRHRGRWIRPWLTAWMDMRSRMIIGRHICSSPNQTTVLLAFKKAAEKYGPPDSAKVDNGKDYDSEMWTGTTKVRRRLLRRGYIDEQMVAGIYAMMDIAVSFSIKYHPQSKSIERFFDTLDCQFTKTLPTYCGKDTDRRPEELNDYLKTERAIGEAYGLEAFAKIIDEYINVYNNSAHTGTGMDGRSPAEVFALRSSRRVLVEGVTDLLLRVWSGELTVGKNGIRFKNIWYGQYDTEILSRQGRKVRVAYDPDDLRSVHVYDAVTLKLITIAEQNQLIAYGAAGEEHLREAVRQKAGAVRAARAYRDSRLTANMDLTSLTIKAMQEQTRARPEPAPQTLRPVRTPMDGQVQEHKRRQAVKAVKKAAGAESTREVLDIDLSMLAGRRNESEPMDFDLSLLTSRNQNLDLWDAEQ